ncbi:MAG: M1 family metallopeptidase, partial [Bacteroidota bacterium]
PIVPTPGYQQAVENGTRTPDGKPGPNYWQNFAAYDIDATLDPESGRVQANVNLRYENNSPDDLPVLILHLRQNLWSPGAVRNRPVKTTNGFELVSITYGDSTITEHSNPREFQASPGYFINGTIMYLNLGEPVRSGGTAEFSIAWAYRMPEDTFRGGQNGPTYFASYWYPQFAVYDDVEGWVADPYLGQGEFYMGFADYNVEITVPAGYLVGATGVLKNPEAVLSETTRERLAEAAQTRETVRVVTAEETGEGTAAGSETHTWHFEAFRVRDFVWGTSDQYVWDATTTTNGAGGETVMVHSFYRPEFEPWADAAIYAQFSIEHLSELLFPYPDPQITVMEGLSSGGGMEYPMVTLISSRMPPRPLMSVTYHELSHMWVPMIVAQNEKAFGWMDEGLTSYNTNEGFNDFYEDGDRWNPASQSYYRIAGTGRELEINRHSDLFPVGDPSRGIALYNKPSLGLHAVRGIFGQEKFDQAYRTYALTWMYKHPYPYDFFRVMNAGLGEDYDPFWRSFYMETAVLDHAVGNVMVGEEDVTVEVLDQGGVTLPALVRLTYTDGRTADERIPLEVWLAGATAADVTFPAGEVAKVELDPEGFLPDVNRENNVKEMGG